MSDDVLGRMVIELGLDHSQFGNGLEGAKRETKYAMAEMKSNMSVVSASGKQLDILQTKQAGLSKAIEAQSRVVAEQRKQYEGSLTKTGAATGATAKYATQLQNANAKLSSLKNQLDTTASAYAKNIAGSTGFTGALNKMSTAAGASGERLKSIGGNLTSIGSKMSVGITAPIVGGFVAAAKSAVDFNSQISAIGPLLTNGGAVTAQYRQQLDQMADSSKKWAIQYGTSTEAINDGMTEMVKRGYTAQQTMGAMPAVLDAAKASGDDFNDVMHVSTSTLEQFGLKTESTSGMLKNTSRVTDSLTYVANATAAGFKDMGDAMTYVGPSAHAAGISLEETAAAIGIMSNKGIEGSVAGTALRGALTRLMKPSKQNIQGFEELGIKVDDFKNGTLTLPEILDKVKNNTKGWTDQQRASAIALAFGTEAQAGMNALISAGGDELRNYTKGAETASGTTKKIADQLNDTQAAKVARFKESLHVLGITIGQQLLPTFTPLIEKATDMVTAFSKMDSGTQQSILKWLAFAAAVGPVTGVLGNIFKVAGTGASAFSAVTGGLARAGTAAKVGASGFDILKSMFSKTSFEALKATPALGTLGAGATGVGESMMAGAGGTAGFLSALAPFAPAILGAVAVIGVGAAAWELWGKKAVESSERTKRWGSDIGADADQAASKFSSFETKASAALDNTAEGASQNAKKISKAFDDMAKSAEDSVQKQHDAAEKIAKDVGGDAGAAIEKQANKEKSANDKRISNMKDYAQQVASITKQSRDNNVKLTNEQRTVIGNLQTKMAEEQVKTLGLTAKQQRLVLAAELNQTSKMSQDQLAEMAKASGEAAYKEQSTYVDRIAKIKNNDKLTTKERNAGLEALEREHSATMTKIGEGYINAAKAQGKSRFEIEAELTEQYGYTASQAKKAFDEYNSAAKRTQGMAAQITSKMSSDTRKAGEAWNNLVLDPKTGKVKTNLPEVLKDAAGVKGGWKALDFELKHAKISTNAKQMIAETLSMSDEWKSLPDMEKTAILREEGADKIAGIMDQFVEWNSLSLKDQQAVVKGDYQPLVDALIKNKQWNQMSLKQQEAVVKDKATVPLMDILIKTGTWNSLDLQQKEAVLKAKGASELADLVIQYGAWNQLPQKQKDLLINNADARKKLIDAGVLVDDYDLNHNPKPKKVTADVSDVVEKLKHAKEATYNFSQTSVGPPKRPTAEDLASGPIKSAISAATAWMNQPMGPTKDAKGADLATGPIGLATNSAKNWVNQGMGSTKTAYGDNQASGPISAATGSANAWFQQPMGSTKNARGTDFASGPIKLATGSARGWAGQGMGSTKTAKAKDNASGAIGSASRAWHGFGGNETVTKIINVVANGAKSLLSKFGFEDGTTDFAGGLAMVNDQRGPIFRELIQEPGLPPYIPEGRNVVLPLSRHAKIVPATTTARMFKNLPQFADGLNVPANVAPVRMARELTTEINETATSDNSGTLQVIIGLLATIAKQNPADLITAMLGKIELSTDVTLDKRSMAKFVSQVANQDIAKAISRAKGGKAI
ncbi:phage tail tape measure protein [Lacticaseibacillus saniviri]